MTPDEIRSMCPNYVGDMQYEYEGLNTSMIQEIAAQLAELNAFLQADRLHINASVRSEGG